MCRKNDPFWNARNAVKAAFVETADFHGKIQTLTAGISNSMATTTARQP
jgi:hypothetical protein